MNLPRTAVALAALLAVVLLAGCAGDPAFTSGKIYWELGEYDKAKDELTKAIENSPTAWEPHAFLGRAYADTDDLEKAHEEFFKALKLAPDEQSKETVDNVITHYWLIYDRQGESYIGAAKFEDAIAEFEKAIVIDPRKPDAYINLGYAHHMSMDYDKAIEIFEIAMEYAPDNEVLRENLVSAYVNKAANLAALKDFGGALMYFERTEQIAPETEDILYNIGLMHYELKDYREAINYFNAHLENSPDDEEVLYRVFLGHWALATSLDGEGQAEFAADEYTAALVPLTKLVEIDDTEITYHRALARVYNKLGRDSEAMEELKKVEELLKGE
jgi:tetratricopeptide (TPR) repeat protein